MRHDPPPVGAAVGPAVAVDMNRDAAVRVVAETLRDLVEPSWNGEPEVDHLAEAAVAALVAAGWGDLAAERERLAGDLPPRRNGPGGVTTNGELSDAALKWGVVSWASGYNAALDDVTTRLIRTTTEEAQS